MKSEKEKMLSGELYQAFGKELSDERMRAKKMVFELNHLPPGEEKEQKRILTELLGKTGKNIFIETPFRCDYGYNIEIGKHFFANYNCTILDCAKVSIGDFVLFGPNVSLFTAGHPIDSKMRQKLFESARPITIGNHVWIGGNTVINPGVQIGDNSVIGSGSVVTKSIPANVIAVGNPCRVLREISESDKIVFQG